MARRKPQQPNVQNKSNKVQLTGVVVENLQDTNYLVEVEVEGMKHRLSAYPAGQMRTYYRGRILKGDEVIVEIDPPYIDIGRIVRKINKNRPPVQGQTA